MKYCDEKSIPRTGLILADNSWRLSKFRTRTILTEESGKKLVCKFAITPEANAFLKAIVMREKLNTKYLKGQFDVLCGSLKGNHIEYKHLPYPSLSQIIASKLRKNHCDEADELLLGYTQKVYALNNVKVCPRKFLSMVGHNNISNLNLKVICLSRALLDLTPRNVLVDENKWMVVDNEWSFDFPIPVVFILFRAILELVVEYQDEVRRTTTKTRPAIGLVSRGLKTYYYPANWSRYFSDTHIDFEEMLRWEMGFQRYITGFQGKAISYVKIKNPFIKFHLSTRGLRNGMHVKTVIRFMRRLPVVRQFVRFLEHLILYFQKQ